jgi:hypothetical protein
MVINIEIKSKGKENSANVLRRFSFQVKKSGTIKKAKRLKHRERNMSHGMKKKQTLRKIKRQDEVEKLIKEGKIKERGRRRK